MRWVTITPLFYSLFFYLANAAQSTSSKVENNAIVRTIELDGALTHVTTRYTVRALEDGVRDYTFALGERDGRRTTWAEALLRSKGEDERTALSLEEGVYDRERYTNLLCILFAVCVTHNLILANRTFTKQHCQKN